MSVARVFRSKGTQTRQIRKMTYKSSIFLVVNPTTNKHEPEVYTIFRIPYVTVDRAH